MLLTGWLVGAAMIVALGEPRAAERQPVERRLPAARSASVAAGTLPALRGAPASLILIPVQGVNTAELRDTFLEARGGGRTHRAMDILAPQGTPVIASVDGTVRKLFSSKAGGLTIYQFDREEAHVYYYAHLDRYADGLAEGHYVKQGSVIGYVGTTGNAAGTPHLHFSIEVLPPTKEWWKGEPVNPYPLLTR